MSLDICSSSTTHLCACLVRKRAKENCSQISSESEITITGARIAIQSWPIIFSNSRELLLNCICKLYGLCNNKITKMNCSLTRKDMQGVKFNLIACLVDSWLSNEGRTVSYDREPFILIRSLILTSLWLYLLPVLKRVSHHWPLLSLVIHIHAAVQVLLASFPTPDPDPDCCWCILCYDSYSGSSTRLPISSVKAREWNFGILQ